MNWGMIAASMLIAWIGVSMILHGDTILTRWLGLFVAVGVAGTLLALGVGAPQWTGWIKPDHLACSQYVYMEGGNWACVPHGQEG